MARCHRAALALVVTRSPAPNRRRLRRRALSPQRCSGRCVRGSQTGRGVETALTRITPSPSAGGTSGRGSGDVRAASSKGRSGGFGIGPGRVRHAPSRPPARRCRSGMTSGIPSPLAPSRRSFMFHNISYANAMMRPVIRWRGASAVPGSRRHRSAAARSGSSAAYQGGAPRRRSRLRPGEGHPGALPAPTPPGEPPKGGHTHSGFQRMWARLPTASARRAGRCHHGVDVQFFRSACLGRDRPKRPLRSA